MARSRPLPLNQILRLMRGRRSAVITALIIAIVLYQWWQESQRPDPPEVLYEGIHTVQRVVDGDTLVLASDARIRLIGPDTPETVMPNHPVEPFGPEATDFTRLFIDEAGGQVYLRFDRERVDKYGRFLAYVYSGERMLNEELIRQGLATAETGYRYSDSMKNLFRKAEDEAKAARRGIWSSSPAQVGR